MPDFLSPSVLWFVFFLLAFVVFYILRRFDIFYIENQAVTTAGFAVISAVSFWILFSVDSFARQIANNIGMIAIVLLGFTGFLFAVYALAQMFLKKPKQLIEANPHDQFLYIDYRYIVPKSFEILYQQILVVGLVLLLQSQGLVLWQILVAFAFFFGGTHLLLAETKMQWSDQYYILFSFLSALIFPYLILKFQYGYLYTYMIHWLFYVVWGVGVGIYYTYFKKTA